MLTLLLMFGISAFMAYWIHSLDDVTNDQLAMLQALTLTLTLAQPVPLPLPLPLPLP